jgi:RNA 2',3'-cyclic 3'-phosphodiesterase
VSIDLWRMFCAVELPANIHKQIEKHVDQLRQAVPRSQASWTRVNNIHVTLKFFGNVDTGRVRLISDALSRAVKDSLPFQLSISGTGAFPGLSHPRVLWIGVNDPVDRLNELHGRVDAECTKEGFEKEARRYRPHLTIARIRYPQGARELAEANQSLGFAPMIMPVAEVLLFRSELSSKGSKYTVVSRHKLSGQ